MQYADNIKIYFMDDLKHNHYIVPVSVILAGFIVGGSIIYSNVGRFNMAEKKSVEPQKQSASLKIDNVKPINKTDHIFGDPNAPVKLVEFSDPECPYCKQFHLTMQRVVDEYGKKGQFAWVYRHFPIDQIHPKARKSAEGSECANELGGNGKFWEYFARYFDVTPSNNLINLKQLPQIAEDIGLDRADFEVCLNSGKYAAHIEDDLQDALASGGEGTPYSILFAPDGQKFVINGSQSYSVVKQMIDTALKIK